MMDETQVLAHSNVEHGRAMELARRGGPDDPNEIAAYETLRDRPAAPPAADYRERMAYRAAAQAVVAQALRCPVREVSVSGECTGHAQWAIAANAAPTPQERLNQFLAFATISAAGHVAEQMRWHFARVPERDLATKVAVELRELTANMGPVPGDVREALAYIRGKSFSDAAAAIVEHQEAAAAVMLRDNWLVVEQLGEAVQAEGSIAGEELQRTLASVIVRGPEGLVVTSEH